MCHFRISKGKQGELLWKVKKEEWVLSSLGKKQITSGNQKNTLEYHNKHPKLMFWLYRNLCSIMLKNFETERVTDGKCLSKQRIKCFYSLSGQEDGHFSSPGSKASLRAAWVWFYVSNHFTIIHQWGQNASASHLNQHILWNMVCCFFPPQVNLSILPLN